MDHVLTIVSHTHWDREWYQPFQEYRIRLVQLVDRLLDLLATDPEYKHFTLDGQTILLEDYLEVRPERESELRRHIQSGRVLVGPWYILPDEFLVGPEATVRNLLLGERVARRFGHKMNVGYVPDCFGHIGQLPQILRGFGMGAAVIWRGVGRAPNEFTWVSPDGSQVLAIHLRDSYGNAALASADERGFVERMAGIVQSLAPHAGTRHLLAMNGTDHLEPLRALSRLMPLAQAQLPNLEIRHGTLPQFVAAVAREAPSLPTRSGELRSAARAHLLPGVFSARMWIKQRNARCEDLLEKWAEPFSALAAAEGLDTPTRDLSALCWGAWRYLIQNHPHDSICGCSVDSVHKEMDVRFDWVEQIGEEVTRQGLQAIATAADTSALAGTPVVVMNPTAGPRTDLVTARIVLPEIPSAIEVLDAEGVAVPCAMLNQVQVPPTTRELNRAEFQRALGWTAAGRVGGEGVQAAEITAEDEVALLDVTLAPLPPVPEVVKYLITDATALLADTSRSQFRLRLHHYAQLDVRFAATGVPAHGFKSFAVRPAAEVQPPESPSAALQIENERYLVEADPTSGALTVTDKASGAVYTGLHRFVDGGDRGDEYNYCSPERDRLVSEPAEPPTCSLVERGPERQTLEIVQTYMVPAALEPSRADRSAELAPMPITTRVGLSAGVPRIDFTTVVENQAMDHRLRVHFPTGVKTDVSHAEGHYDVVARPVDLPHGTEEWPEQPTPTHHQRTFVDVHDGAVGLMVANKGLPEYEVIPGDDGVTVALTLLRCVGWLSREDMHCRRHHAGPGLPTPGAQCLGDHTFEYALIPHSGGWENAFRQAHAFNTPMRAVTVPPSAGPLPAAMSFVEARPADFVITAIKRPEAGGGLVVRGYNITGEPLEVTLRLGRSWGRAARVRLDETGDEPLDLQEDLVRFRVGPKEVVTLRFED